MSDRKQFAFCVARSSVAPSKGHPVADAASTDPSTVPSAITGHAMAVAAHLPSGPFSLGGFADHAMGLNLMTNAGDAQHMIDHLVEAGVIVKLGPNIAMWVAVGAVGSPE